MKKIRTSKLSIELETIHQLTLDRVAGGQLRPPGQGGAGSVGGPCTSIQLACPGSGLQSCTAVTCPR